MDERTHEEILGLIQAADLSIPVGDREFRGLSVRHISPNKCDCGGELKVVSRGEGFDKKYAIEFSLDKLECKTCGRQYIRGYSVAIIVGSKIDRRIRTEKIPLAEQEPKPATKQ